MDHGQGQKCNFLVRWLLGLLAVIACVMQCLMDMQFFCLCAWLMDGWMDGCCVDKGGTGCGGRSAFSAMQTKYRQHLEHRVAWFGLLGLLVSCLFDGWMDGWPDTQFFLLCAWLMDGWMGGCMDGRTDGRTHGRMLCKSRREGVRGRAQRYRMGGFGCLVCWLLGGFVGLAALLFGWLVG